MWYVTTPTCNSPFINKSNHIFMYDIHMHISVIYIPFSFPFPLWVAGPAIAFLSTGPGMITNMYALNFPTVGPHLPF